RPLREFRGVCDHDKFLLMCSARDGRRLPQLWGASERHLSGLHKVVARSTHGNTALCNDVGPPENLSCLEPVERPRHLVARNEVSRQARDTMKAQAASAAHRFRTPL